MATVEENVKRLNDIQTLVYNSGLTDELKAEWFSITLAIKMAGFKLKKKRSLSYDNSGMYHSVIWFAKPINTTKRNQQAEFILTDVRPTDRKTLKGDCTTRAMAFVLNGEMSYDEIEKEQYRLADEANSTLIHRSFNYHRNTRGVWEKVILSRGWTRISFLNGFKKSEANIAAFINGAITSPVIALSANHASVIDENGRIRDTWDSRGCRVTTLIVRDCDVDCVSIALSRRGIGFNVGN